MTGTNFGQQDPFTQGGAAPSLIDGTVVTLPGGGTGSLSLSLSERVALGLMPGWRKLGARTFATAPTNYAYAASTLETEASFFANRLWSLGASVVGSVNFTNAADTSGGVGIRSVVVEGIDQNGLIASEVVNAPVAPGVVPTVNQYNYINELYAASNGGTINAAGNIDISLGGLLQARILPGDNRAFIGGLRIPADVSAAYVIFEWAAPTGDGFMKSTLTQLSPVPQPFTFDLNLADGTPKAIPMQAAPPLGTAALFARSNTGGSVPVVGSIELLLAPL